MKNYEATYDAIASLYDNTIDRNPITLEQAEQDLRNFRAELDPDMDGEWLEDLTAEEYAEIWNSFDTAYDEDGNEIIWELATQFMDDEIREELHAKLAPCTKQVFWDEYCKAHEEKYDEPFRLP